MPTTPTCAPFSCPRRGAPPRTGRCAGRTAGWLATKDYLAEYELKEDREELGQKLLDHGLRHIPFQQTVTLQGQLLG